MIAIALVFAAFGCGRPQSPADSIALGRAAHTCTNGGTWDGLECAKPHEQAEPDEPTTSDHPKPSPRRRGAAAPSLPKQYNDDNCDCDSIVNDPECHCDTD
jgi:hypothetical protein